MKGVMQTTNPPPEALYLGMCVERQAGRKLYQQRAKLAAELRDLGKKSLKQLGRAGQAARVGDRFGYLDGERKIVGCRSRPARRSWPVLR